MDSLLFLYGENKVIFDLSFEEQANDLDRNNHEMKILVNKNDNNINNINNNITPLNNILYLFRFFLPVNIHFQKVNHHYIQYILFL